MALSWEDICHANRFDEASHWLKAAQEAGALTDEVIDGCWGQACSLSAWRPAQALFADNLCPSSGPRMRALFERLLQQRLKESQDEKSALCFGFLLAAQEDVSSVTALALAEAGAAEGLGEALLRDRWAPSPEEFLKCFRALTPKLHPACDLVGRLFRKHPKFAEDHPDSAHTLMLEVVPLVWKNPDRIDPVWAAETVIGAILASGKRRRIDDDTALLKFAQKLALVKDELDLVTALGKVGYPLPEACRGEFFSAVLKREFDEDMEGSDPRLDPDPWRRWASELHGIDRGALARLPSVAEAWLGWREEALKEAWAEDGLAPSLKRPRL